MQAKFEPKIIEPKVTAKVEEKVVIFEEPSFEEIESKKM
jgi:hypothetical protein